MRVCGRPDLVVSVGLPGEHGAHAALHLLRLGVDDRLADYLRWR